MKTMRRNLVLMAATGLAMSATASAQYAIVNSVTGNYVDISSTGTALANVGDDTLNTFTSSVGNVLFPAGTVTVCSNGFMCAGTATGAPFDNDPYNVPPSGMPTGSGLTTGTQGYMLPYWDDLYAIPDPNSMTIYWQEINGVLIVQWHNIGHFVGVAGQVIEFEVKVFANPVGGVYAQYLYQNPAFGGTQSAFDNGASATIGYLNDANTNSNNMPWSWQTASLSAGTVLSIVPDVPGACCMPDGTCSSVFASQCAAAGSVFRGGGTTCANANCPQPGACCIPSTLTCSVITASGCTAAGGTFVGVGVTCAAANCPTPGACCLANGSCVQTTSSDCGTQSGVYHGDSTACASVSCPQPGACCLADGSCIQADSASCAGQGGAYHGDNTLCGSVNCGATGACCAPAGCSVLTQLGCIQSGGIYTCDNSTCATANCPNNLVANNGFETGAFAPEWTQFGDPGFTAVFTGTFDGLSPHSGNYAAYFGPIGDTGGVQQSIIANAGDMLTVDFWYACYPLTPNSFSADLGSTNLIAFTDDTSHPGWTHFSFTVPAPTANPVLAFTMRQDPAYIFLDDINAYTPVNCSTSCYANCDHSTTQPCLNVLDFGCFLNKFTAGDTYANCDHSTTPPVLNVLDFTCFLNKFASGCSSC